MTQQTGALLRAVLILKIGVTLVCWAGPMLLLHPAQFEMLGFPVPEPFLYIRLLGMAYLALVVGYAYGYRVALKGYFPSAAVAIGIVSNGGAAMIILAFLLSGKTEEFSPIAYNLMVLSGGLLGLITLGLVLAAYRERKAASLKI